MIQSINSTPSFKGTFMVSKPTLEFADYIGDLVRRQPSDFKASFYDGDRNILIISTKKGSKQNLLGNLTKAAKRLCKKNPEASYTYYPKLSIKG